MEKRIGFKSLKVRLIRNLILVLLISYIATVLILISFVRSYFYNSYAVNIESRIKVRAEYYRNTYAPYSSLISNIYDDKDNWWNEEGMRVQIFDIEGNLILDSYGDVGNDFQNIKEEVRKSLNGIRSKKIYTNQSSGEHLIALIEPLKSSERVVGVLVFTSSLAEVDYNIFRISILFFVIGGIVSTIAAILGVILGRRLVEPINNLTETTQKMAKGDLTIRNVKTYNDEIGYLSDNFNAMARELKNKEDMKNEFISSVSHELRTPLTSIKGWAATLKDPSTDSELMNIGLGIIEKESDRLRGMVEELLEFSTMVSGKLKLNLSLIDVEDLIQFVSDYFIERSRNEKKIFKINNSDEAEPFMGDLNRIKQVIINLIENSFRFTSEGDTIELKINQNDDFTRISVSDTGIGIPSHELSKVKEKFFKGKHSKSQNGIGLSVSDEIAKSHGGSLNIESRYGEGTEVTFEIPRRIEENEEDT